jgi:hypothetical protein
VRWRPPFRFPQLSRNSAGLRWRATATARADFLVERRGFEPLASAVQAPARLTGSSLPFLGGSLATSATVGAALAPPVPAPCVASASNVSPVSTRTAWLPVECGLPDIHFELRDIWVSGGPWNTIVVKIWQIATHGGGAFT